MKVATITAAWSIAVTWFAFTGATTCSESSVKLAGALADSRYVRGSSAPNRYAPSAPVVRDAIMAPSRESDSRAPLNRKSAPAVYAPFESASQKTRPAISPVDGVGLLVSVGVGVADGESVSVGVGVGECVSVGVGVTVSVADAVAVNVAVGLDVSVGVDVPVAVWVGDGVKVAVGVRVGVADGVNVPVGVAVGVGVELGVRVAVGVGEAVAVAVGLWVGVGVRVTVGVGVGVGDQSGLDVTVGVESGPANASRPQVSGAPLVVEPSQTMKVSREPPSSSSSRPTVKPSVLPL